MVMGEQFAETNSVTNIFLISQVNVRPPSNNGECLQMHTFRVVCVCVCVCAPIINSENSLVLVHLEEKYWDSLTRILLPW